MGGSEISGTTELRHRDPENEISIPTPVTGSPSTPTSQSLKRKFEEDPPHLDLSTHTLANKYPRYEQTYVPPSPQSSRASRSSECSSSSVSQESRPTIQMAYLARPINFVFGKLAAFTEDFFNQFKTPSTPPANDTASESTQVPTQEFTQEPIQEPTPDATPDASPDASPKATPEPTRGSIYHAESSRIAHISRIIPPIRNAGSTSSLGLGRRQDIAQHKTRVYTTLAETLARRDAPKKRLAERWPTVTGRDRAHRASRVRVSNLTGSPLSTPRAKADEIRRSQRRRPTRIDAQFEEARKARLQDSEALEAYIASLVISKEEGFKSYDLLVKERAKREAEIQRLKEQKKIAEEPIVKPLSKSTLAEVLKTLSRRAEDEVLIENTKARVSLSVGDMKRLDPNPPPASRNKLWLNDSIIDLYMYMIAEKANAGSKKKKVHAFGVFFWSFLRDRGPKAVERQTKRAGISGDNLLGLDLLLVPANFSGNHWCLGVVKPKAKQVEFYDSLGGISTSREFFDNIRKYLINELKDKVKIDKPWEEWWKEWTFCFMKDGPRQQNGWDCGVFACKIAEVLARGRELTFTQAHMRDIRYRMVAELLKGELGVE